MEACTDEAVWYSFEPIMFAFVSERPILVHSGYTLNGIVEVEDISS